MNRWITPGRASVLVGGQFGSEGKGLAAAWLAEWAQNDGMTPDIATTNAGAQAGHTTRYRSGTQFICYHLPTTGVTRLKRASPSYSGCQSYVNAGSIIDVDALLKELDDCTGHRPWLLNLTIHPRAAIITDAAREEENRPDAATTKTASTRKGVGATIAGKIMRRIALAGDDERLKQHGYIGVIDLNRALINDSKTVVVEIPQGTDLSINHGLEYPYVTSRDCWVGSGLSDAGIHPSLVGPICMVVRTMPIRVGNIVDEFGHQLGQSGPFYPDGPELSWERDLPGVEPERTTVTKRIRRIAAWSDQQYDHAIRLNHPTIIFVNFLNYLRDANQLHDLIRRMRRMEEHVLREPPMHAYSFGPCVEDVVTDFNQAVAWYDRRDF